MAKRQKDIQYNGQKTEGHTKYNGQKKMYKQ